MNVITTRFFKFLLPVVLLVFGTVSAQTTVTVGGGASVTCPATPTATWTTPPAGVTFSNWSRGSGVACATASTALSGSGFNTANAAASYTANKYFSVTITADATHTFTLNSLVWDTAVSGGTANFTVQYSNNGGAVTTFGTAAQTNQTSNTFSGSVTVASGTSLVLYLIPAGLDTSGRTVRWNNGSTINITATSTAATITSGASGNWSSTGTWVGGVVPTAADNVIIASGHTVTLDNATYNTRNAGTSTTVNTGGTLAASVQYINNGTTTINGSFQLNAGGYTNSGNNFVYGAGATLIFNNTSSYGVNSADQFWPTTNGPTNVNVLQGGLTLNAGTNRTVSGTFQTAAGVTMTGTLTLSGTAQLNGGGFFASAPTYTSTSTLVYNTSYGVGNEWTGNGAAGIGIPQNITIQNSGAITMPTGNRGIAGNLNITSGSLTLNGTSGDLYVGGNWTNAGTFNANGRAVFFNGTGAQGITNAAGETFSYLIVNKSGGTLTLNNNVTINATSGNVLQLINTGGFDINGKVLTLSGNGGSIQVTGTTSTRTIASTGGGSINITGSKSVVATSATLVLGTAGTAVTTTLSGAMDFGASLTTVNGTLQINAGGSVNTNSPRYGTGSLLKYNTGGVYGRTAEWTAATGTVGTTYGYPNDVQLSNSTTLNVPNTGTGAFSSNLGIGRDLTIDSGSALYMDYGGSANKSASLTVLGNFVMNGAMSLGDAVGGDMFLRGNWTRTGTFTPNGRTVNFNGTSAQQMTGATTFAYLTLANANGLTLNNPATLTNNLVLTSGKITLGANNLTVGGTISGYSSGNYIVAASTGQLRQTVGSSNVIFPVGNTAYNPITLNNTGGTSDIYGVNVLNGTFTTNNDTKIVLRRWQTTEAVAGGSNLTVVAQYNTGETAANYGSGTVPYVSFYNGTNWSQQPAALAGSNPFTATTTAALTPSDITSGTQFFAIGKDDAFATGAATKLAIIAINPATPTAGQPFSITVQSQNGAGVPTNVSMDTNFYLDTNMVAGDLSNGTQNDIILSAGSHTKVVTGVVLMNPGTGVTITAIVFDGDPLADGTSAPFNVGAPASQLAFVGFPTTGNVGSNVASFTVEARRADNSVDQSYTGNITVSKATGPGSVTGTLTVAAVAGVATFNAVQFGAAGSYTLNANASGLSQATSSSITISLTPVSIWTNPITGTDPGNSNPYTTGQTVASNMTVSGIGRGTGVSFSTANDRYNTQGWNSASLDANDYISFTLTPNTGYQIVFSNLVYTAQASGTGPTNFALRSSLDNYTANIGTPTATGATISLSASQYQTVSGAITFRLYGWGASAATGTFSVNDFTFNGNVICITPNAYTVGGGGAYCTSGTGATVTLSGSQVGINYQLKRNGVAEIAPVAGTGSALSFTNLTASGTYTIEGSSTGGCAGTTVAMTGSVSVSADSPPVAGSISGGGGTVCSGTNSTPLTLSGHSGSIQWQSSTDNTNFTNIGSATSTGYTATNLSVTTYFRVQLSNGACTPVTTSGVVVNVTPGVVAGSVTPTSTTVCSGSNSTLLTLAGNTGTIQWQSSTDNTSFTNIGSATGQTYTATNLTATTYYRAQVTSGSCGSANTASVVINVNPAPVAGTISGGGVTVCSGTNSTGLTLNGSTGSIQWQSSTDNTTFNNIVGATSATYTATNLTATTYYRAQLSSSPCSAVTTTSVAITVNPASVSGTISGGNVTVCAGTNNTVLTLNGSTGSIQWQSSSDNSTFSDISGQTGTTYTAANLAATTYYRAVVTSGVCAPATSGSVAITVNPASVSGTISGGNVTVCAGTNNTVLTLNGSTGSIQWQSSSDNSTFSDISGQTGASYSATNLTATTYYRAVVTSGVCAPATSGSVSVTVNPASVSGTISGGNTTVCAGTNNTVLTLNGSTGSIQWQSSSDNSTFSDISGETGTTYTATNLTATTYYRAVVTSGVCAAATSGSVAITVNPASVSGTISGGDVTVCTGANNTVLTLNGSTGTIQWQSSSDNSTFSDISGETGTTYTVANLASTTYYRAVVTSGVCAAATSASVAITVGNTAVAGSIGGGGTFCGGGTATLTLTGYTGAIQWQSSTDNITFNNIGGETNATYNATISGTMYYRVVVTNGGCSDTSASVSVSGGTSTTWDGTAWSNGAPDANTAAIFAGNYTASGDFAACTITVNSGAVVIPSGFDVNLNGSLTVSGGSFTLENNANLLQATNAVNTGNIIVKRNSSAIRRQDYTLWSSPVTGQNLLAFSPLTVTSPTSRFYQYNSSTNLYNSITAPGSVNFADAKGYLIRVANNHPTWPTVWNGQFTGVPHNGNYDFTMYNGGNGFRFNCVGNPYPSPVSMVAFAAANSTQITQTLYFWRETNNNTTNNAYCSWSPAGGANGTFVSNGQENVVDPQGVLQTGQGFFVEASASGTQVSFTNAMRLGNNANQFFRPASMASSPADSENHRIWLNVTNQAGAFCQTAFGYMTGATNAYDLGIEGRYINSGETELYSLVDADKLVIQGRALPFIPSDVVPLGFKAATAGTYAIAIDHVDGLFAAGQAIYLKDNATGAQHLLNDGAYSFTTDAGEFASRFEVLYQTPLGTVNPTLDNVVTIVGESGAFTIDSGNAVMDNVKVFDIRGRLVKTLADVDATRVTFAIAGANQVLIVKITAADGQQFTRKVVK